MFLSVIRWLWFLNPYLHYVFPVVMFITSGKRIRMMILLYCMMSTYDMIASMCMKLGLYLHAALRSFPYLGSYVLEFVNNQTQSVGKTPSFLSILLRTPVGGRGGHVALLLPGAAQARTSIKLPRTLCPLPSNSHVYIELCNFLPI